MEHSFEVLAQIVRNRRTVKPGKMNGKKIENAIIPRLIELANWAPTHGRTEPWRFFVFAGERTQYFCAEHAAMYRKANGGEMFRQETYDKLLNMGNNASHIIMAVMQRGSLAKIPELEEIAATAAAVQNILLGAEALGIAVYWGSGGMVYSREMKEWLGLAATDIVLGALYLGYTDLPVKEGTRNTPISEKIKWM